MTLDLDQMKLLTGEADPLMESVMTSIFDLWSPVLSGMVSTSTPSNVLELGTHLIASGEFLARRIREPGALDDFESGGVALKRFVGDPNDPFGLKKEGWRLLRPYMSGPGLGSVGAGGSRLPQE